MSLLQRNRPNGREKDGLAGHASGVGVDTVFIQVEEVMEATEKGGMGRREGRACTARAAARGGTTRTGHRGEPADRRGERRRVLNWDEARNGTTALPKLRKRERGASEVGRGGSQGARQAGTGAGARC